MHDNQKSILTEQDKVTIINSIIDKSVMEINNVVSSAEDVKMRQQWSNNVPEHDLAMARSTIILGHVYLQLIRDKMDADFDAHEFMGIQQSVFKIAA